MSTNRFRAFAHKAICILAAALIALWSAPAGALALSSSDSAVKSWDVVKTDSSYVFTIEFDGSPCAKSFAIAYDDNHQGNNNLFQTTWDCSEVKGDYYQNIDGASITKDGSTVTVTIPKSYFANDDFTVSFGGSSIKSSDIAQAGADSSGSSTGKGDEDSGKGDSGASSSGKDDSKDDKEPATYNGIKIDGDFSDWDAVKKYDFSDIDINGNKKNWSTVDKVAMVWDGDWIYLYFESSNDNPSAMSGAGPHNNGQFAITTDLGNQTLIQLQQGPSVAGVNGAKIAANNYDWAKTPHKWEVAIPASSLGYYKETIDFGLYKVEPAIKDVADLKGSKGGDFDGIVYDGKYDDWNYYPHSTIEYATSGTQEHVVDSRAALYADSEQGKLYGHVVTSMPAHLDEAGGEFTHAVSIRVNGNDDLMLTPRFIAVDESGNINWNPTLEGLQEGTYEFYLTSTTVNGTSKNINSLQADDVIYGKATITVGKDGKDEMEWEIDIPTLAANLHKGWGQSKDTVSTDPSSIKLFEAKYGRLGQEWVRTAGTSTAPFVAIALCVAVVAVVWALRSRRQKKSATQASATQAQG